MAWLRAVCETIDFKIRLRLSCQAIRMQYRELSRRIGRDFALNVGTSRNVMGGPNVGQQGVYVTMEPAPRQHSGLWMRIDVFRPEGYQQTYYPFWRNAAVFFDFLALCEEQAGGEPDWPRLPLRKPGHRARNGPRGPKVRRLHPAALALVIKVLPRFAIRGAVRPLRREDVPESHDGIRSDPIGPINAPSSGSEPGARLVRHVGNARDRALPFATAGTSSGSGRDSQRNCSLLCFPDLASLFDHVLVSGNRIAVRILGEAKEIWAVVWRRADGGLFVRCGGPDSPISPLYCESPQRLYEKLSGWELDLDRVWSQNRHG